MIQRYDGFKAQDIVSGGNTTKIPAGAYVGRIYQASIEDSRWGKKLVLLMDVTEGPFANYYHNLLEANINSPYESQRKYKGVLRLNLPSNDGTEGDATTKSIFGAFIFRVHQSNPGYNFEASWDERTLVGKNIGMLIREAEWGDYDAEGHPIVKGVFTEIGGTCTVDQVRQGNAPELRKRTMRDRMNTGNTGFYPAPAPTAPIPLSASEVEDLPF